MDPLTIAALTAGGLQGLGSIFGSGGDSSGGPWNQDVWWDFMGEGGAFNPYFEGIAAQSQQLTPEYTGYLRDALSGNMGIPQEALDLMAGRLRQNVAPQNKMAQDTLRSSFNPRLAGSGAMGDAMANLLGQQSTALTGGLTDINIQDMLSRYQTQRQGLGQFGQLQGQSMQAYQNAVQQFLSSLGR